MKKSSGAAHVGVSATATREFLLQSAERPSWDRRYVERALGISAAEADQAIAALATIGYIEAAGPGQWRNTGAGNAVAGVSRAAPMKRETIRKQVDALIARAREVNADDRFLYRVARLVLFGPYLEEQRERVKNADIAIDLQPKERDRARLDELSEARAREAAAAGKRFKSYADRRAFAENQVRAYLKGRTRAIALYPLENWVAARPHRVVFEA